MIKQLVPSLLLTLVLTALLGLAYPLAMTGAAQALFPRQAHGSLIERDGKVVGSELVAQGFTRTEYFHPRPSANGYDAASSGGSNAAPTSKTYIEATAALTRRVRAENPGAHGAVPVDLVTASGSGLDPHLSPEAAEFQVPRVAAARNLPEDTVRKLVAAHTRGRVFGVLGEPAVNVLALNLALDSLTRKR